MKFNPKKLFLMIAMALILVVLFIMISQRNLIGELACLGLTGVLFLLTYTRRHPNTRL